MINKFKKQINPLYSGRFSIQLDKHNKDGIVQYMFEGVIGQNFLIIKEIFLTSAKSVNPDEMQHFVALHVGLQYLQKYSFWGVQNAMG